LDKKQCFYRAGKNTNGSLGEQEMRCEQEQANVSTAFSIRNSRNIYPFENSTTKERKQLVYFTKM